VFDTQITVIGNVITAPEWRRTSQTGQLVASFKVASTARRLDRGTGQWVDGNSLRVRVSCWRRLAEGVAASVMVGDPIVVVGRLYTRDWVDEDGQHRVMYEMEATAVGHDLSRGRAKFARNRATGSTSTVEDDAMRSRVGNEDSELADLPTGLDPEDPLHAEDDDPTFGLAQIATLRGGGFSAEFVDPADDPDEAGSTDEPERDTVGDDVAGGDPDAVHPARGRRRVPVGV
jgi:single-strand DNA-binding protein